MADSNRLDSNRLAGVASVTIDGRPYSITGEGTYRVSGSRREALTGQDGWHGYSEMPTAGAIHWKGRDSGVVSIGALSDASNVTVVLALANGKTVIGRNMVRTGDGPLEVNTEDASFDIMFEGPDVMET